MNNKE